MNYKCVRRAISFIQFVSGMKVRHKNRLSLTPSSSPSNHKRQTHVHQLSQVTIDDELLCPAEVKSAIELQGLNSSSSTQDLVYWKGVGKRVQYCDIVWERRSVNNIEQWRWGWIYLSNCTRDRWECRKVESKYEWAASSFFFFLLQLSSSGERKIWKRNEM